MIDQRIIKVAVLSAAVFGLSLGVLFIFMRCTSGAMPVNPLVADIFSEWQFMVKPEREAMYYHVFAATVLLMQAAAVILFRKHL